MPIVTRARLQEAALALLLCITASVWGTVYWNRSFQAGRQPQFYQSYFEPAVMLTCGRGFLLAHPPVPAVADFLAMKVDRLSCDQIPPTTGLSDYGLYQKTWLYLMLTVALTWKVLGISWSGMAPLFGILFGATILAAYGMFRLGMGRLVSAAGAAALAVSAVHLQNLPHLRDYAKAPITLTLIWLLFAMAARPPAWRRLLAIAFAYGLALGIGYGFRTDFLAEIPVFFVVLFAFVSGGWLRHLPMKCAAAALCLVVFVVSAWPVIAAVRRGGGCQWHAGLLGLTDPFNDSLMISPGPYSFGHQYSDDLVYAMTTGFARRVRPDVGHIDYCSPEYDAASGRYLATLATTFPADFVTRTFASIEQIAGVPFRWTSAPLPGFATWLFRIRRILLSPFRGTGVVFVGLALALLAAADLRLGVFGLFIVSYFGGYPMLQFGVRHYFHLEVLTWWAIGFSVQHIVSRARRTGLRHVWRTRPDGVPLRWDRAAVMAVVAIAGAAATLWLARGYQQRAAAGLFREYVDAPKDTVRLGAISSRVLYRTTIAHPPESDPYPVDVIEVETDGARCGPLASATFRYGEAEPEFTHDVAISERGSAAGTTRVFEPVYARFEGVEFSDAGPGCVTGVFWMSNPDRLRVLLGVRLAPGWEHEALYERRPGPEVDRAMSVARIRAAADSTLGRVAIECAIVVAILVAATNWGAWYWNRSEAIGRRPSFYQLYYEPAVMLACGKGFVVAQPQVPAMSRFLTQQTNVFYCGDIPKGVTLSHDVYEGLSPYLMRAAALTWRISGVSWRRLGPLAGVLFGVSAAASYGIFRLGMGRVISALLAWLLSMSALQLLNLPHIRDYSKAPFALLLVFLLGVSVTRRQTWRSVLAIAAASGVVAGVGYGFRTDVLIYIPAFVLTMFLFLDAKARARLMYGLAATAVFAAAFCASAWPVLAAKQASRCQWHVTVLGLGSDATKTLQLRDAVYDWLDGFTDEFVYATSTSYAARLRPGVHHIDYCGPEYDDATRALLFDVARHAPADFLVRAYASSLQMVQLPWRWRYPPMPHVAVDYYRIRSAIADRAKDAGLPLAAAAVFLVMASSLRLGLFLVGFLLYVGGYPAVQFGNRHFFHLEFIGWWALGFLAQQLLTALTALARKRPVPLPPVAALRRSALVCAGCVAGLAGALWIARAYQESALKPLLQQYVTAQVEPVATELAPGGIHLLAPRRGTPTDPETAELIEVDLNEWQCPADSKLTFVYDRSHAGFAREMTMRAGVKRVPTRIFLPVYASFRGVSVGDAPRGCLAGVYRVRHPERFALMPKVVLRPGWEDQPLYQSLIGWGLEPPPDE